MKKMVNSGWSENYRREILKSGLNAYSKINEDDENGIKPMFRPRSWRRQERDNEKDSQKRTWFKKGGHNNFIHIPATPGGELKKDIEEKIQGINKRLNIKIVEHPGRKLIYLLKMQEKKEPLGQMRESNVVMMACVRFVDQERVTVNLKKLCMK